MRQAREGVVTRWRQLTWGLALWLVLIAVPYGWLYPGDNLSRPICIVLALLPPLGMLFTAATAHTHLVLGIGLASQVPILVACPELIGPRTTGAVQGLAVAMILLGFASSTIDQTTGPQWRASPGQRLRRLLRWPASLAGRLLVVLGFLWIAAAWYVPQTVPAEEVEAVRTGRVAAVALCWMAVRVVPMAPRPAVETPDMTPQAQRPWLTLLLPRLAWMLALVVGLVWWHG